MTFDAVEYTRDSLAKELYLVELHSKDGSAVDAGCSCIQEKHLLGIEGLAEEGIVLAKDEKEKQFYKELAEVSRELRKKILNEDFNPSPRAFMPHGLTEHEQLSASHRKELSSCISEAETKCCGEHTTDYSKCTCNPVAVCRASLGS